MSSFFISKSDRRRLPEGMRLLEGGEFLMGSEEFYPEEKPVRRARVGKFWIDEHPVTNREFSRFVDATGYKSFAEISPDPRDYPDMPLELAHAGSAVFMPTRGPVPLDSPGQWWRFVFGADWRHPLGPDSGIDEILDHPVVQIAYEDAAAYAKWVHKELPSEAEWEFAARGGLDFKDFSWGDELEPGGEILAKYWRGKFPWQNLNEPGTERTSPVGTFPANGFGLYDMIGNVWEWTADWYSNNTTEFSRACCGPPRARSARKLESLDPHSPKRSVGRRVVKGGSHLCSPSYCQRYRPAARHPQAVDSPTSHIGFRCIRRVK